VTLRKIGLADSRALENPERALKRELKAKMISIIVVHC
jgi:flagellar biosynthesis regulator FlaF